MSAFKLMNVRGLSKLAEKGINTVSDVEIYNSKMTVKNDKKQIYHLRLDYIKGVNAWKTIQFFTNQVLPHISNKFVLIVSGEDLTIPNLVDKRYHNQENLKTVQDLYTCIINHPFLLHCYIENYDANHEKVSSLPCGICENGMPGNNVDYILKYINNYPKIIDRELKCICIHRSHNFATERKKVEKLRETSWKDLVIYKGSYRHDSWYKLLQTYPFILCVNGGGLEPSPKAWEALCCGCIPIIKRSPIDDAYEGLPIIYVDEWNENTITLQKLKLWRDEYAKFFDDPLEKQKWVDILYLDHWKNKIKSHLKD